MSLTEAKSKERFIAEELDKVARRFSISPIPLLKKVPFASAMIHSDIVEWLRFCNRNGYNDAMGRYGDILPQNDGSDLTGTDEEKKAAIRKSGSMVSFLIKQAAKGLIVQECYRHDTLTSIWLNRINGTNTYIDNDGRSVSVNKDVIKAKGYSKANLDDISLLELSRKATSTHPSPKDLTLVLVNMKEKVVPSVLRFSSSHKLDSLLDSLINAQQLKPQIKEQIKQR